jgi:hypothetical protein
MFSWLYGDITGTVKMVDSDGTEVLNYPNVSSTLYIRVVDTDLNTDASTAETTTATVISEKETTAESVTLTETGVNTGIYQGSITFQEASANNGDGVLQVSRGEKLTASYVDAKNDFGNEQTVTDNAFYGTTTKTDTISSDEVWTKSGSPYLITGDVTVNDGVTLTVNAGTEIRFIETSDDQSGGQDQNRSELRIQGILRAVGTATDSIIFTSNAQVPAAGDWYGIYTDGGRVILKYCRIEYTTYGIKSGTSSSSTDTVRVEYSRFRYGGPAYYKDGCCSDSRPFFFNNNIVENVQAVYQRYPYYHENYFEVKNNVVTNGGFYFSSMHNLDSLIIDGNTLTYTSSPSYDQAIYIQAYHASDELPYYKIRNNTIIGNKSYPQYGIYISGSDGSNYYSHIILTGNTIKRTNYFGVYLNSAFKTVTIKDNTIKATYNQGWSSFDNTGGGIHLYSNGIVADIDISGNTIDSTGRSGMYLNQTNGTIESNQIINGGNTGIYLDGSFSYPSLDTLQRNKITGNNKYGIYNSSYSRPFTNNNDIYSNGTSSGTYDFDNNTDASVYSELNAKYNYWGTTATSEMDAGNNPKNITRIYDKYDNSDKGFVNYGQWLSGSAFIDAPAGIKAFSGNLRVTLTWNKIGGSVTITKNKIYRGTSADSKTLVATKTLSSSSDTSYVDTGLQAGTTYYYWVTSVASDGTESTYSDVVSATPSGGPVWYVNVSGGNDDTNNGASNSSFATIGRGIIAAANGDTVKVSSGTYTENINFAGKNIVVMSTTDPGSAVIDGGNSGSAVTFANGESSSAQLKGFTIRNGYAKGSSFPDESGGGIVCTGSSSPRLENLIVVSNKATKGGGGILCNSSSNPALVNVRISDNESGEKGGAVKILNSSPTLTNVTIANNSADSSGGAFYLDSNSDPVLLNSIVWGNSPDEIKINDESSTVTATYSDIKGGYSGTGNINSDPTFVNASGGNYKLTDYSPAIGTGTSSGAPSTDIYGNTRGSSPDMGAYENELSTPVTDQTAPTVGSVNDGLGADLAYTNTSSKLSANWSGFRDKDGIGISYYEYAVGTSTSGTDVKDWTSSSIDSSVTIASLELSEGSTYYLSVRATDKAGNVSETVSSNGVAVDVTAPTTGTVVEGGTEDQDWTNDANNLKIAWSGFEDSGSEIGDYFYSLGTASGATDVEPWSGVGSITELTLSGLGLQDKKSYYVNLKATDGAGNTSSVISSDGITVDLVAPSTGTVRDGTSIDIDYTGEASSLSANWLGFSDATSGLKGYEYAIGSTRGGIEVVDWTNVETATSVTVDSLDLKQGIKYFFSVRVSDHAGNVSNSASSDGVTADYSKPIRGEVIDGLTEDVDWTNDTTSLAFSWTAFIDTVSPIAVYEYLVTADTSDTTGDKLLVGWTDNGLKKTVTLTGLSLTNEITYYAQVRATDATGQLSGVATSDGITIDITPPEIESVLEWKSVGGEETDWIGWEDEIIIGWEAEDNFEIEKYRYSVGSQPGDVDIKKWTYVDSLAFFEVSDYSVVAGVKYYTNARAVDMAGNISETISSDGFEIDAKPPRGGTVIVPDLAADMFLTSNTSVPFRIEGFEDNESGVAGYQVGLGTEMRSDDISKLVGIDLTLEGSIDSLQLVDFMGYYVTVTAEDSAGNISSPVSTERFRAYTTYLGDFDLDKDVDAEDLSQFVALWPEIDIGPAKGETPYLMPQYDGKADLRDAMVFGNMWYWSLQNTGIIYLSRATVGAPITVTNRDTLVSLQFPPHVSSGEVVISYEPEGLELNLKNRETISEKTIVLTKDDVQKGLSSINFGQTLNEEIQNFTFSLKFKIKEATTIEFSYLLFDSDGNQTSQGMESVQLDPIPQEFLLHQNYPNPFNPQTTIRYDLPEDGELYLSIHDIMGREVTVLKNGLERRGYGSVQWDGKDVNGRIVGAGVYFSVMRCGKYFKSRKMILLK